MLWPATAPTLATPRADDYWQGFANHICALLPLWTGHIALGKEQMDDAANRLTMRFDGILRQVGGSVRQAGEHTDKTALAQAESRLKHMLELLQNATRQQTDLAIHLHTLGQSANTLQNLVRSLVNGRQLDSEQNMEQLGNDTLEQLARLQTQIDKAMGDLAQMAHEPVRAQAPLNPDAAAPRDEEAAFAQSLPQALEDILVQLQFQDRVDQILSGVQNDMRRLENVITLALAAAEHRPEPPDTAAWLEALKNSYTTHEQRVLHSSDQAESGDKQNNITFLIRGMFQMAKTILIVDDSASLRQVVRMTLAGAGYEVLEAANGQEALDVLDGRKVHLIVSDVNMPLMDGIALLRNIKVHPNYKFTPVIMLTTESSEEKKQEGKAAGAKAWVVKPFQPPVLLTAVSKLILP